MNDLDKLIAAITHEVDNGTSYEKLADLAKQAVKELERQRRRINLMKNTRNEQLFKKLMDAYEQLESKGEL